MTDTGPDDGAPIGAAATLPLKGEETTKKERSTKGRKRKLPGGLFVVLVLVGILALALLPMFGSALAKTPKDRVGISYGGGPIEGAHFQKIVQPGSALFFNGVFDKLFLYPADQRTYIISPGEESSPGTPDFITAPTSDRVQVSFQVALYYKLNTNRLREFHEELGLRFSAYTESGWDRLVRETFQPQVESAVQEETRRYEVGELYGNADQLASLQSSVQTKISERLKRALGQEFFCGPDFESGVPCNEVAFVIKRMDVPESIVASFENNRTSEIEVQTKLNEVAQREAEADSIAALNEAITASGGQYTLLKAIESGKINFWVLPDDSGVTLQAPDTGGAAPAGGG